MKHGKFNRRFARSIGHKNFVRNHKRGGDLMAKTLAQLENELKELEQQVEQMKAQTYVTIGRIEVLKQRIKEGDYIPEPPAAPAEPVEKEVKPNE